MKNNICAVMQPTYLPWSGFFNLIYQADHFVFLDDAQYSKNSWHNRNQIIIHGEKSWITLPVQNNIEPIFEKIPIYKSKWNIKHVKTLESNYGRHPYFDDIKPILFIIENFSSETLSEINIALIMKMSQLLEIEVKFHLASKVGILGQRSERLVDFSRSFHCDTYLSPVGSKDYLEQDGIFYNSDINLKYQNFNPVMYEQKGTKEFIGYLSIIDVVANIGWVKAKDYIKGGL